MTGTIFLLPSTGKDSRLVSDSGEREITNSAHNHKIDDNGNCKGGPNGDEKTEVSFHR
jgi:hypothetical protein